MQPGPFIGYTNPAWGNIDEVTASDSDYIAASAAANDESIYTLSDVSDPGTGSNHMFRLRAKYSAFMSAPIFSVKIYDGTTLITTKSFTLTSSYEEYSSMLTSGEANSITDYTNLRVGFYVGFGDWIDEVRVSWFEFEVPS